MRTQQQIPSPPETPKPKRGGLAVVVSALVLVLIVGAVVLITSGGAAEDQAAANPSTTVTTETESAAVVTPDGALAVANAFYVTYNRSDAGGTMALFSPDATFSDNITGSYSFEEAEMRTMWNAAQGTTLTSEGCSVVGDPEASSVVVSCQGSTHNAQIQAVDGPPVPTKVTMTVTPDGISDLRYVYGSPNFNWVGNPFLGWMRINYPDDAGKTLFGAFTTLDEAREYGQLIARYASEWAAYLDDNGCTYSDDC